MDLLDAILDSWDRNNTILVNLLRILPPGTLELKATAGSKSIAQMFTHMHYVRLIFVFEDVPEFAQPVPTREWLAERDPTRIAALLIESSRVVRDAVKGKVEAGGEMKIHFDHPILMLQHLIWHEAYHHGQIKLVLKGAGHPLSDDVAGPVTWDIFMDKS